MSASVIKSLTDQRPFYERAVKFSTRCCCSQMYLTVHGPPSKSLSFINLRYDVIFLLLSEICIGFLVGKIPHHQRRNGENSYFLFFLWHSRHNPITSLPSASFPFLSSCSSSSSCAAKSGDFDAKGVRSTCHRV